MHRKRLDTWTTEYQRGPNPYFWLLVVILGTILGFVAAFLWLGGWI